MADWAQTSIVEARTLGVAWPAEWAAAEISAAMSGTGEGEAMAIMEAQPRAKEIAVALPTMPLEAPVMKTCLDVKLFLKGAMKGYVSWWEVGVRASEVGTEAIVVTGGSWGFVGVVGRILLVERL